MIAEPITVDSAVKWAGGETRMVGESSLALEHVTIDSRIDESGAVFVALPGSNSDGHQYVEDFLEIPLRAAIVRQDFFDVNRQKLVGLVQKNNGAVIAAQDPLSTLGKIAKGYLGQFSNQQRVAITGSNGKTATKELLRAMLAEHGQTFASAGNYNSAIGVPLSALEVKATDEYLIFEVGTGYKGEISAICSVIEPEYVLITNIGHAHIEFFGSQEAIAAEKIALAGESPNLKKLFITSVDGFPQDVLENISDKLVLYAEIGEYTNVTEGIQVTIDEYSCVVPVLGSFQRMNISGAAAVARELGCTDQEIIAGLPKYHIQFGRMERLYGKITVLQDCYNANPESMREALQILDSFALSDEDGANGSTVAVLGSMKELGSMSRELHREILELAASLRINKIFCCGREFKDAWSDAARPPGFDAGCIQFFDTLQELQPVLVGKINTGDVLLLKGSRAHKLERISDGLRAAGWVE